MTPRPLMSDQTLFRNPALFEAEHLPETFYSRDTQMAGLALALRPTLHGARPLNTVLQGPPGTGKTTAVRFLFAEVEEETNHVVPVLVSCQTERTAYAVLSQVYLALFDYPPPTHGASRHQLLTEVGTALADRGAVLVVCLDDAHLLVAGGVLNDMLTGILRLHEVSPGARTGVVMTDSSRGPALFCALDPSTRSSLQATTIDFPPYTAAEVRDILADRVRAGVYPGVVPAAVLDDVVARTVGCGDLRVGLRLLKETVVLAEGAGRTTATTGDVKAAFALARHARLVTVVEALAPAEQTVLAVLAGMAARGDETTSGLVYEAVTAAEPMSYTRFYEQVKRLEALRVVRTRRRRKGQGKTREIMVAEGVGAVLAGAGVKDGSTPRCAGVAEDGRGRYETGRG